MSNEDKFEDVKKSIPADHATLQKLDSNTYTSLLSRNQESERKNSKNIQKKIEDLTKHLQEEELRLERDCENRHQKVDLSLQTTLTDYEIIQYDLDEMKGLCNQVCAMQMDVEVVQHGMDLKQIFDDINTRMKVQHQPPQIPEFIAAETMPNKDILREIIGTDVATIIPDKYEIETKFTVICSNTGVSPLGSHCGWIYSIGKGGPVRLVSDDGTIILQNPNEKGRKIEKIFASSCKKSWITDLENSKIEILKQDGELENRFEIKSGFHPFGICLTKSCEAVWICLADKASFVPHIKGKTKVVKMTIKGVKVCEIESFGGQNLFTFPYRCVESSLNEDLYVVDRQIAENRGQVFFFDKDCKPKGGYTGGEFNRDFDPRDICCNCKGEIIIADFSNNAIHILCPDGILRNLLRLGLRDLTEPTSVATDVNDRIWVGYKNGDITIISKYQSDYNTSKYRE